MITSIVPKDHETLFEPPVSSSVTAGFSETNEVSPDIPQTART
jgi:hypothetical protein